MGVQQMADEIEPYSGQVLPEAFTKTDGENWRLGWKPDRLKFDDRAKLVYLETLYRTGKPAMAARAAGVNSTTVRNHLKADPELQAACEEALALRAQQLVNKIEQRAMDGFTTQVGVDRENKPIFKQIYETSLAAKMLDRYDPAYKNNQASEGSGAAVLIVPGGLSNEEWKALFTPAEQEGPVIDGTVTEVQPQPSRPRDPGTVVP